METEMNTLWRSYNYLLLHPNGVSTLPEPQNHKNGTF